MLAPAACEKVGMENAEPHGIDPAIQKKRVLYLLENNPSFLWAIEQVMANRGYGDITIKLARFKLHRVRVEIERDGTPGSR